MAPAAPRRHLSVTEDRTSFDELATPIGTLRLVAGPAGLLAIEFPSRVTATPAAAGWRREPAPFRSLARQLGEYFAGRRREFEVELAPLGTPFQRAVWAQLRAIPFGTSISYAELARRVGRPSAFRAVGGANGANPWPIVVPCHRVVGSDRSLTGFGGGLEIKRALLRLEAEASGAAWLRPAGA
jgi:methylated-DNA-[protein]-cysteine S-methyltransferase